MAERLTELTEADRQRAATVLTEHARFIEAVATRHAAQRDAVPDIVQEVGIRVCQSLHLFRNEAHIKTWLFAVTRNLAVDGHRKASRFADGVDRMATLTVEEVVDVEADLIEAETRDRQRRTLRRALHEVCTPRQQEAVRNMLAPSGVSLNRDKASLFRARRRMRRWITAHGDDQELTIAADGDDE